jgi:dihydroxy-acid dehydratase
VAPESFIGGPLALVETGDEIEIDIPARKLTLHVPDAELAKRRAAWKQPPPRYTRGYGAIFTQNVTQANEGCDFAVLASRDPVAEPDIF